MRRVHLSGLDASTSVVATISFVAGFLVPLLAVAFLGNALFPSPSGGDDMALGLTTVFIALPTALAGAWGGSYAAVTYFGRLTHQAHVRTTWFSFAVFVWGAFAVTVAVSEVSSRAFVTAPTLFVALAGAYLAARAIVVRRAARTSTLD